MRIKPPKAPAHLKDPTRKWWRIVVRDYDLEDHHLRLLQAACETWDRMQQAREAVDKDGLTVPGREGGLRPHPCIAIERDCKISFARLIRDLDLDIDPPSSSRSGPPALRSSSRGR